MLRGSVEENQLAMLARASSPGHTTIPRERFWIGGLSPNVLEYRCSHLLNQSTLARRQSMRCRLMGLVLYTAVFAMSGCVAGDALLLVNGKIAPPTSESACQLSIRPPNEPHAASYYQRQIEKNFSVDFTVSPYSLVHLVRVECDGYRPVERRFDFTKSKHVVDLGEVVLVRE
jgi:hypothetical protein